MGTLARNSRNESCNPPQKKKNIEKQEGGPIISDSHKLSCACKVGFQKSPLPYKSHKVDCWIEGKRIGGNSFLFNFFFISFVVSVGFDCQWIRQLFEIVVSFLVCNLV